jgi:hypothetical protein
MLNKQIINNILFTNYKSKTTNSELIEPTIIFKKIVIIYFLILYDNIT